MTAVKVSIVFEPDPDLGPDPEDEAQSPRRLGEFIDSDKTDVLLMWREYGEQFEDGNRTHIISTGVWENITADQMDDILERLGDFE